MRFAVFTSSWTRGGGSIVCRRCNKKIDLSEDSSVLIWDDGLRMSILSPADRSLRHRCGRRLEWACRECGKVSEPTLRPSGRKKVIDTTCMHCFVGRLVQREVVGEAQEGSMS